MKPRLIFWKERVKSRTAKRKHQGPGTAVGTQPKSQDYLGALRHGYDGQAHSGASPPTA